MKRAVLSVDPGLTSGVCFITWNGENTSDPEIVYSGELLPEDYAEPIRGYVKFWKDYDDFHIACERFVINAQTVRNSQAPYSLEQIGILKEICRDYGFPVENIKFQAPVDAKNMFPNKALKILKLWHVGGGGHALDAIRHALLVMVRLYKWIPRALLEISDNN
jgi:hypothetical protein